jgi:asparagine synthase (glutamine-hydrolysing)
LSHLRNAIERRLTATDTIGVYLSGGLDSSLVASLLVEAGVKPHLFTLDFGEPFHLELPIAEQVAKHLHLPLRTVSARPSDIAKALEKTVQALPLPFGDAVTVPLYLLGQTARDFVSEVWNGEGGDQLFGGWTNKPMIAAHLYDLAEDTESVQQSEVQEYLATYHRFWGQTPSLYTPYQQQKTQDIDPSQWITPALDRERFPHLLHRLRYANLLLKGAQNIAPRMLALAHCHGLKVCSPLFDANLTEWTFSLPPEMFLSGACEKFLLKQIAERYLPTEVVWREKRGMGVPVTSWCLSRWSPSHWTFQRLLRYYLSNRRLHHEGRFEPAFVQRLLQGEDSTPEGSFRKRRVGEKLWLLLIWEIWREQHGVA